MHTTEFGGSSVPAFLVKLWKLVEDEECNDLISWNSNGQSFIIHNQTQFAKELLPLYFKHNNMASLIRQLNIYGFRKVTNTDQGLRSDREEIEFFHSFFIRGQECLLEFIKRKVPTSRAGGAATDDGRDHSEAFKGLLSDVGSIQGRQEHMDQSLADMKRENGALWREVARLRQKHMKQQQIIGKLIEFLVTMVQANRNITVKRKVPFMLHDTSNPKMPRLTKAAFVTNYQVNSPADSLVSEGPVIHDVTDLMEDLGETSGSIVCEPLTAGQSPREIEVSRPATPVQLLASPAATRDLDTGPIVASSLNAADAIEPLVLLDPLPDDQSSYVAPCDIEEVVVNSSEPSPKEPSTASSKSLVVPTVKTLQVATPATSAVKQTTPLDSVSYEAFTSSNLFGDEEPTLLGDRHAANGTSDLLSSCVMLEGIPMFVGDSAASEPASPLGLTVPATSHASEGSPKHKEDSGAASVSPDMQVALQDKAFGNTKVFAEHLDSIDYDLDWLQDQLMTGALNLDTSTLMGLFSSEDPLTSCLGDLDTEGRFSSDTIGNEVVQYTPSLLDLGIEEDSSFEAVNELLLSDDEVPSSLCTTSIASGESISRPNSLVASGKCSGLRQTSSSVRAAVQTVPRSVTKKGTLSSKKRRGSSKK
ncbi:uncharacterized protein LOC144113933 isoform X3 [Amblyomma americanum]